MLTKLNDTSDADVADVAEKLRAAVRDHLGCPELRYAETPQPLVGGYSNPIYRFRLGNAPPPFGAPLVLRLTHDDGDTAREAIVQAAVAERGYQAPAVLLRGSSTSRFGRPFLVTSLMVGCAFDKTLSPRTAIGAFRRLPHQLAAAMSALHDVPTDDMARQLEQEGWPAARLDSLGVLSEVDEHIAEAKVPELRRAAALLREHQPSFSDGVACHGDVHPFNLLFNGRSVAGVLDWELARIADNAFDVGRTVVLLRLAPYPMPRVVRAIIQPAATSLASSFVNSYRRLRPLDEYSLRWHEALHCLRTLAITTVGATRPIGSRLRRTADIWLPVAPRLEHRFAAIAGRW
jgi:aminoglycoside phosphotransferase (APT) family kinase protein